MKNIRNLIPRLSPRWAPYVFVAPFVVLFLVFGLFPLLFSFTLAFAEWQPAAGFESMKFVGLQNFAFALHDAWFWKSLGNTLWLALLAGLPQHLVAIPLAVFIHGHYSRLRNAVVGAFFVPYITSTVAMSILFMAVFSTHYGMLNQLLQWLHLSSNAIDWLGDPEQVKTSIGSIVFWRYVGFNTVLYLAAIQAISADLYEAALMDGAKPVQSFWYITLPSLRPVIYFAVTLSVIGGLQLFDEAFIMTSGQGGPDQAGLTAALYMYREAFDFDDFGGASAMSWILFALVSALTALTHWLFQPPKGSV